MPSYSSTTLAGGVATALTVAATLYLALLVALYVMQRRILFLPNREPPLVELVGQPGLQATSVTTTDGLTLLAWWLPPAEGAPVILYLHGNAGHIGHRGDRVRCFAAQGWGALLVEYRGYGGNPGAPSEAGLLADGAAGMAELARRAIPAARIVLWGESLGSGVAVPLAATHEVGAVVLETPFTSIADIARAQYPYAPVDLLLKDRFDSLSRVAAVRAPLLIVQGGRDRIVPPAMGRALLAAATAPAELWLAEEGGHSDLLDFGMAGAVADFLARRLPAPVKAGDNCAP